MRFLLGLLLVLIVTSCEDDSVSNDNITVTDITKDIKGFWAVEFDKAEWTDNNGVHQDHEGKFNYIHTKDSVLFFDDDEYEGDFNVRIFTGLNLVSYGNRSKSIEFKCTV